MSPYTVSDGLLDILTNTLGIEIRCLSIAGDAGVFFVDEVSALVDFILDRSVPERQSKRLVDADKIDVLERHSWAGVNLRAI